MSEEILHPAQQRAQQSERLVLLSLRYSFFLFFSEEPIASLSFFFCLSFSSLTHLLSCWCSRSSAEE